MRPTPPLRLMAASALLFAGCDRKASDSAVSNTPAETPTAEAPSVAAPPATTGEAKVAAPLTPGADPPASAPTTSGPPAAARAIATEETQWAGVIAEVTEFRRKGNTVTAKVRFRNQGSESAEPALYYTETYVIDAAAGKKYEVLKDEANHYIAALRSGYANYWKAELKPGESQTIWMKFPAPPLEVKAVTLQVPGVPPFEDVAIQDS